jgi:hypothetical protein
MKHPMDEDLSSGPRDEPARSYAAGSHPERRGEEQ